MKKIYLGIAGLLIIGGVFFAYNFQKNEQLKDMDNIAINKVKVVTSFYPLAEFAKYVGGDLVDVTYVTPAGTEPHDYEPTPRDIANVYDSRLFILNGNGLDSWGEKIQGDLKSKGVAVLNMSTKMQSLENNFPHEGETNIAEEAGDPHFWLDPINVQKQADAIAEALVSIDSANEKEYNQNRDEFKQRLADLDREFQNGLASCQIRQIVTSHNAFNYLANRYNLSSLYILGISPDEDPSPQTIASVADEAKRRGIKYIFFETLVSPKLSQTIADEIGAKTLVLNPFEGLTGEELSAGKNYFSVMKENLDNLKIALACQ